MKRIHQQKQNKWRDFQYAMCLSLICDMLVNSYTILIFPYKSQHSSCLARSNEHSPYQVSNNSLPEYFQNSTKFQSCRLTLIIFACTILSPKYSVGTLTSLDSFLYFYQSLTPSFSIPRKLNFDLLSPMSSVGRKNGTNKKSPMSSIVLH
jgi:hypothetical protein